MDVFLAIVNVDFVPASKWKWLVTEKDELAMVARLRVLRVR
jgi:hypothetical protein